MRGESSGGTPQEQGAAQAADLPPSRTEPDGSAVVRLLSYNIRSLRDDREALVRVIRACAPDVVCVQEAPRFFRWRKRAAWLARRTGLTYVTGGATAAGPMILASLRAHVERAEDVLLPRTPGLHQRGFAMAELRFGTAARLGVVSFHLSLQGRERRQQARALLDRVAAPGVAPVVAAGDVNERPGGPAFGLLGEGLRDAWGLKPWGAEHTSPASEPVQRIDAVFAGEGVEVLGAGVPRGLPGVTDADLRAATDHLPVLAALRVPVP
ncbi:endonuclease/exonuclease/phosphatase family protein [Streptomyces sp. 891-h]|uniref:endonuclease/exonuclease/phosphatase family protein n=1 Tax=unclassified Streptomyces TaxID=2593676 RepID=UPI001FAB02AF|nr:endonuclease/exonuclease/phosphatase family protein [Streptomyces sp. 891-h]UNZ19751.1 endonuclease [Streptomyces sp. 891-h]